MGEPTDDMIVSAIRKLSEDAGYSPTIREVMEAVGMVSTGTMSKKLQRLRDDGRVTYVDRKARTLRVTK